MEGAYLAHSVYGFFQNGGGLCWIVRVGDDGDGAGRAPRAALPAAADASRRGVPRRRARGRRAATSRSRSPRSPTAGEGRASQTYKLVVDAGADKRGVRRPDAQEGPHNIATKVNAASKLIKIEETGASLPEAQRVPATGTLHAVGAVASSPATVKPTHFEGDVARRKGMGGLAAVDEVTMVVHARHDDARRQRRRHRSSATSRAR